MTNNSIDTPPEPLPPKGDTADKRDELDEGASFPIVGIGASAGGLEAFTQLLKALPLDTGMGFVLVQHLDPEHESALTQILARTTSLPVHEVTNNQAVQANHVYIIPPDTNLSIAQGVLKLEPRPKVRTPHRPIDTFFESLSQDRRERAIGVVLSGTASDGTLGLEAIKAEGGITFAQDDSAKYDSMPRSAVGAGCVDLVLSPADIAKELARIAKHPYVAGQPFDLATRPERDRAEATKHEDDDTPLPSGGRGTPPTQSRQVHDEADGEEAAAKGTSVTLDGYRKIMVLLRNHSGVDFSLYKSSTIQRRITRRLVLSKLQTLEDYAGFLRGNAKELDALYSDVLISVTSFFRNPEMFDVLQREVFPKLLKQPGDQPIRVWVLGCSTGQEAYSIAMTFLESAEKVSRLRKLQVFATDLNDTLLDKARNGLYAKSLADDITPERLRRFFIEEQGGYRVCKMLREMVVFARQNLIADTPFSRMDLVSCRNLLIYLEPSLQKKAMPTFHYALKPGGFLLLGASESIGGFTNLFEPVDKKYKIYSKKPAPSLAIHLPVRGERDEYGAPSLRPLLPLHKPGVSEPPNGLRGEHNNVLREADRITISQFAPPGVVVNSDLQVLQFRGRTGAYLEPPIGKATLDVLKMAREGLMLPLRSAINEAKKENRAAHTENVRIKQDGKTRTISLDVIPLKNLGEIGFLILFDEAKKAGGAAFATQAGRSASAPGLIDDSAETGDLLPTARKKTGARQKTATHDEAASRIADLENELSQTREYLQSIQEQYEAANEELQAASEEVQSSNEELQSINEELETSKEEMESANEELTTVNEEMSSRNIELDRVNNDLVNLQTSAKLAIVLLGRDLTIRRFSSQAEKQFDLLAADVGRPISHIRHKLVFSDAEKSSVDLEVLATGVIADVREQECEVRDNAHRWHLLRVRPYMTLDNKVDGAVLVLVEIEAIKRSEQIALVARSYAENTLETVREPLLVLDHDLRVESANRSFYRTFRVAPAETVGTFVYDLGNRQWNIPRLRELLHETLSVNQSVEDFEVKHHFEQLGCRSMLLNARRIIDPMQSYERILLAIEDITDRKQAEETLRASTERLKVASDAAALGIHTYEVKTGRIEWDERVRTLWGVSPDVPINYDTFLFGLHPDDKAATQAAVDRALDPTGDGQYAAEYRVKNLTDGVVRWVAATGIVFFEESEAVRLVGTVQDITKRKKAEEAVRESERDYRALADASLEIPYRMSADWSTMLPLDGREVLASSDCPLTDWGWVDQYLPRDEHARVRQTVSDAIAGKILFEMEHRVLRLDGSIGWVRSRSVPILDENEEIVAWFGAATDITPRKLAEEMLCESERDYRALAVASSEIVYRMSADWSTLLPLDGRQLVASSDQSLGDWSWLDQNVPPDEHPRLRQAISEAIVRKTLFELEHRVRRPDGSVGWTFSRAMPILDENDEVIAWFGAASDITERKEAVQRVMSSEARLRRVFESNVVGMIRWDLDRSLILDANAEFFRMTGYVPEDVTSGRLNFRDLTPPEWAARNEEGIRAIRIDGLAPPYEKEYFRKDGSRLPLIIAGTRFEDSPSEGMSFLIDLSEMKRAEAALRASADRHSYLVTLADALRPLSDPIQIQAEASRVLGEQLDTNRVVYFEIQGDNYIIERDYTAGVRPLQGGYPTISFGPELLAEYLAGRMACESDVDTHPLRTQAERDAFAAVQVRSYVGVPLIKGGVFVAGLSVNSASPRTWTPTEIAMIEDTAERTWAAVARVRAEAALRASEERRRLALDAAELGTWHVEPATRATKTDVRYRAIFGTTEDWTDYLQAVDVIHPDDQPAVLEAVATATRLEDPTPYAIEYRIVHPDGSLRWVFANGRSSFEGTGPTRHVVSFDGTVADITDRKRAEQERELLVAQLREQDRCKDEFLATLAHELRNPLAPIRNGLQIIKLAGGNPNVVEKSREMMERQVGQMTHLIDDLMDVSRINQGKIVLQKAKVRLADVIQDAVDTSRLLIEERGHDLVVDVPPEPLYVDADRTRLAQVFGNLLNNAAKYTDTGGRIRVAVVRQGDDVVVAVEDNGVGISPHLLTRVFDMFSQLDRSLEKSQGGLGIGLNIVKRLAEMHDGDIVAESGGHGAGSRFVVRLPIALSLNAEQRDEGVETVTVTAGRRILVVDDNRDAAISLAVVLEAMGHELQTAHDGLEAFDLAAAFRPDLVLLDIAMPKLNGYDTARRIREQTWGKSMVLVALTGWGQDEDQRKSQEAGFDAHLIKPVDPAALDKLLGRLKTLKS